MWCYCCFYIHYKEERSKHSRRRTLSILQSQFIEKGFKKAENSEQNVVLLLLIILISEFI